MGDVLTGLGAGGGEKPYEDIWLEGVQTSLGRWLELRYAFSQSSSFIVGAALLEAYTDSNVTGYAPENTAFMVDAREQAVRMLLQAIEVNNSNASTSVKFKVKIRVFFGKVHGYGYRSNFYGLHAYLSKQHIAYDPSKF